GSGGRPWRAERHRRQRAGMGTVAGDTGHREISRFPHRHAHRARGLDPLMAEPVDVASLTRGLVDIDSTTGREGAAGRWLAEYLRGRGWNVVEQRVDDARFNVIATLPV